MTCCLLEKAEREWGAPLSRAIRTPRIFLRIFCAFLRDSGTPIFQAPKRRRKICAKMGAKICAPKICAKWAPKICAPKICAKMGVKMGAKICAKNRFEHSVVWKMEARKKNTKRICAKLAQNPSPKLFLRFRPTLRGSCVQVYCRHVSRCKRQLRPQCLNTQTPGHWKGVMLFWGACLVAPSTG